MASDLQHKSKQTDGVKTASIKKQNPIEVSAEPDPSPFTPEQQQILGNDYLLILGWRRERLMKASQSTCSAERQA